jgi:hypothetical protein
MFTFDFNIDDADDLEDIFATSEIHSLSSEEPSPKLELFTETLIDHLVRCQPYSTDWQLIWLSSWTIFLL